MIAEANRRISMRVYPKRKCVHCGDSYVPHDRRQQYCRPQHKIDAGNDRRRLLNQTRFLNEKYLRKIDWILEKLESRMKKIKKKTVTLEELFLQDINSLDICVELGQGDNDRIIKWYYNYGLQAVNLEATVFKIIKRINN
jgi:hypothetical protein